MASKGIFRRTIFWLHLVAGVVAAVVILNLTLTGILMAYERQIIAWADGAPQCEPRGERLPLETLLAPHAENNPLNVTVLAAPTAPVEIAFAEERVVFVDPYTGVVLGEGAQKTRAFFHWVTEWHRWFALKDASREVAKKITGGAALTLFGLTLTGIYMWWPTMVLWFKRGLGGKARDWNWHNVFGFWCALPLLVITLTGSIMAFAWANNLVFRLAGSEPPPARAAARRGEGKRAALEVAGLNLAWARAEQQAAGWQSIRARLPGSASAPVMFTIESGGRARPDQRAQLTVNRATGAVEKWEPYSSLSRGRQWRSWVRWIHTGEAAGVVGQTVAFLAATGGVVLVWTGLALTWRRFCSWRRKKTLVVSVVKERVHASCP